MSDSEDLKKTAFWDWLSQRTAEQILIRISYVKTLGYNIFLLTKVNHQIVGATYKVEAEIDDQPRAEQSPVTYTRAIHYSGLVETFESLGSNADPLWWAQQEQLVFNKRSQMTQTHCSLDALIKLAEMLGAINTSTAPTDDVKRTLDRRLHGYIDEIRRKFEHAIRTVVKLKP